MRSTAIINIGTLLTGSLETPILEEDSLLIEGGRISKIGNVDAADRVIDVGGATVGAGLIDSHCHVVLGDYTPRQKTVGFLESYVHGGVTQAISPGEIHTPGRPRDRDGVKALAVAAAHWWKTYRPGGMKVHGGSVVLEPVLSDDDFKEIASQGVRLAKFGFGAYEDPADGLPQVKGAQAAGIKVMSHSGGASIPGSKPITTDHLLLLQPDVCGHINGGPTSLDEKGLKAIINDSDMALQLVQAGNLRSSLEIIEWAREAGAENRVIIGSDTPTGTGVIPLAMLKTMAELCSLGGVEPGVAWAWSSGVTSQIYDLEAGAVEIGKPADLIVCDTPWGGLADDAVGALKRGDIPGISAVLIDGEIRTLRSRNTPAATRAVSIEPAPEGLQDGAHV